MSLLTSFGVISLINISIYTFALYSLSPSVSWCLTKIFFRSVAFSLNYLMKNGVTIIKSYGFLWLLAYRYHLIPRINLDCLFPKPPKANRQYKYIKRNGIYYI